MSRLVGRVKIEQNLAFIINVYSDDILNNLLEKILNDLSENVSHYTSKVEYQDCQIDDRDTKCYFIKLFADKDSKLSVERIKEDVLEVAERLMHMYKSDKVYLEILGDDGEWIKSSSD